MCAHTHVRVCVHVCMCVTYTVVDGSLHERVVPVILLPIVEPKVGLESAERWRVLLGEEPEVPLKNQRKNSIFCFRHVTLA